MYIESVPNRNSPPTLLLRRTYRIGNKVFKETLTNLNKWPSSVVQGLRKLLEDESKPPPPLALSSVSGGVKVLKDRRIISAQQVVRI